jgi:hypothetical protein
MTNLGMIDPIVNVESTIVMRRFGRDGAVDGIWLTPSNPHFPRPASGSSSAISGGRPTVKGEIIGEARRFDRSKSKTMTAPVGGHRLWWKETMRMRNGDILCVIGF